MLVAGRGLEGWKGLYCCSAGLPEALEPHQASEKIYKEGEVSLPKQGDGQGQLPHKRPQSAPVTRTGLIIRLDRGQRIKMSPHL